MRIFALISLLTVACASLRTVSNPEVVARRLNGVWKSDYGSLVIGCSGGFSIDIVDRRFWPPIERKESGAHITDFGVNSFKAGAFAAVAMTYQVTEWPNIKNGQTRMTIDDRVWILDQPIGCGPAAAD